MDANEDTNAFFFFPPPLLKALYRLPTGATKPAGWLRDELTLQAKGISGQLPYFWHYLNWTTWMGTAKDPYGERSATAVPHSTVQRSAHAPWFSGITWLLVPPLHSHCMVVGHPHFTRALFILRLHVLGTL